VSTHIGAEPGQVAPTVLLPGDPLRARYIAETFLQDAVPFNQVRGMLGFTGRFGDKRISVMGTGMGIPTLSIYVTELMREYQVRTLIRVGTCGAFQPELKLGDILLAMTSSSDSNVNRMRFHGLDYAPSANFDLLLKAYQSAQKMGVRVLVGNVFSTDSFYQDDPDWWRIWADYGVLACDMETAGLYTLAAQFKVAALSVLTVSDSLVTQEYASATQREKEFSTMAEIALEIAP